MDAAAFDPPTFDLQGHSTCSDGELSPGETVRAAQAAGVECFALTDHDSVDGLAAASAAARELGLVLVPGVEISVLDPVAADLHMCGYLIDRDDQALRTGLEASRNDREVRAQKMVAALRELGWEVDQSSLDARTAQGLSVGRPHIAAAVFGDPRNAARLARERLEDPSGFLVAYLIEGRAAFVERGAPSAAATIELVHGAGGVAVWAHPFWDLDHDAEVIATLERFKDFGIDGIEAFYITHTQAQTELLVRAAARLDLLTTGSSDFHGPGHRQFNRFRAFSTYGHVPNLGPLLT